MTDTPPPAAVVDNAEADITLPTHEELVALGRRAIANQRRESELRRMAIAEVPADAPWLDPSYTTANSDIDDDVLLAKAREMIRSLTEDISDVAGDSADAVEHGLYGFDWPPQTCGPNVLCDIMDDAMELLRAVAGGAMLDHAIADLNHERWRRVDAARLYAAKLAPKRRKAHNR
jgi:hypothetical protein